MAQARATSASSRAWLRFEGETYSLDDVWSEVDRYAVGLAERGVTAGDRVTILCGNRPETIFAWLAANRLGAIAAPLNPAYKPAELAGVHALIDPRVVVATSDLRALAESDDARRDRVAAPAEVRGGGSGSPEANVTPDDVAVLLATSGTTGAPKAVMQTHRTYALTAEAFPWWVGLTAEDTLLCPLPLFHVNAQAYSTMGALGSGGALALVPKFSASRFWSTVRDHRATEVNAVGAMIHILLSTEPAAHDRDHGLRVVYSALALPEEKHRAFERRFGVTMMVGYGLSETTFGTVWPRDAKPYGTMGVLRQHPRVPNINRARVVRDDGADAADGETGELYLASPAMMRGYFGDETQTRAAFTEDGTWFKTGDLVKRHRGGDGAELYTFVARKKEVLRRRGENVAAAEIENAIASHPAVHEVAVKGFPSPLGEDEIVGFVVPKPGMAVDPEDLRTYVKGLLADYKVPSRIC